MAPLTLQAIEVAIRDSWDEQTCDPADQPWSVDNPARGQCGVTAAVVHDLLGGELLMATVHVRGEQVGHHAWNQLGSPGRSGIDVDLTYEQFGPEHTLSPGEVISRPPDRPMRIQREYEILRRRVSDRLGLADPTR